MKISFLVTIIAILVASPASAATPVLICENSQAKLVVGICGIRGCDATVTDSGIVSGYLVTRQRFPSGALTYNPAPRAKKRCTFSISALRSGLRNVVNTPVCARSLKGARCRWVY